MTARAAPLGCGDGIRKRGHRGAMLRAGDHRPSGTGFGISAGSGGDAGRRRGICGVENGGLSACRSCFVRTQDHPRLCAIGSRRTTVPTGGAPCWSRRAGCGGDRGRGGGFSGGRHEPGGAARGAYLAHDYFRHTRLAGPRRRRDCEADPIHRTPNRAGRARLGRACRPPTERPSPTATPGPPIAAGRRAKARGGSVGCFRLRPSDHGGGL